MKSIFGVAIILLACCFITVTALNNGLARTPQMGWNSWNHYLCGINETVVRQSAAAVVANGLKAAGYNYINVDDCWAYFRDSKGDIHADPITFPSGMKALADYVHSLGLKFGLYSDAGTETCAKRPGSLGYEKNDANSYASWGVDYLKYDNCNNENIPPMVRYPIMRDALNATGRPILYSMCEWGKDDPATWAPPVGNSWRTTGDIQDNWTSMLSNLDKNNLVAKYAAPGGWNDPDMLEIGNGGMTNTEYKSHFSLWCLMKAPLLVGCDVIKISKDTLDILTAPEVIAVNQDPLGVQGYKVAINGSLEVWAGPLSDRSVAVILFNRGASSATITARWIDLGLTPTARAIVRDLWARSNLGIFANNFSSLAESHGVVMLKISPLT